MSAAIDHEQRQVPPVLSPVPAGGLGRGFSLWDGPSPRFLAAEHDENATIEERFLAFHAANPWVYEAFVDLARDLVARGRTKIGAKALFEVIRWNWDLNRIADTDETYRLNNNHVSRYARLAAESEPELAAVFNMRALRAA